MDTLQDSPIRAPWLFNSETGRKNALLRHNERKMQPAIEKPAASDGNQGTSVTDGFREQSASRTREQIKAIQMKMDALLKSDKLDTKAMRELADTLGKLEVVEQKLSGRASPGSLRPRGNEKPKRGQSYASPLPEVLEPGKPGTYQGPENG